MKQANRREFLRGMAMAGGALVCPSLLSGEDRAAVWKPKLALSSVMFSGLPLADFCAESVRLGFKGIDLWGPFGRCRHLAEARDLGAGGFLKLLEKHGQELGAWTTYRTKVDQKGFPGFAEFIGACGGGVVVRESKYADVGKDQLEAALRDFFKELQPEIDLAREHKVKLAIENHAGAILNTIESIRAFAKLNPAPEVVGIALAPYHLQTGKASVIEAIEACGNQLVFFYAWQLEGGVKQLPGHGPLDFAPWMEALARQDYHHWMTPFMHGDLPPADMAAAVATSARYLRGLR
jgi:sugar phosphate isomerase/epimerase